ncbi:tetratricopeptide repeat protein [Paracoccus pacificus]|uniref:Tetratricopeptide repeat protein n=1 Tax=Paracoccus pacificus TaxID=1463598 RepID=A0ABW4RB87_9RHOB
MNHSLTALSVVLTLLAAPGAGFAQSPTTSSPPPPRPSQGVPGGTPAGDQGGAEGGAEGDAPAAQPDAAEPDTTVPDATTPGDAPEGNGPETNPPENGDSAQTGDKPTKEKTVVAGPPMDRLAGPYLAARLAAATSDFTAAANYFSRAIISAPDDVQLLDGALVSLISAGDMVRAVALADRMEEDGNATELSGLVKMAKLVKAGDWKAVLDMTDETDADLETLQGPAGERLMGGLIRAWAELGAGQMSNAIKSFEETARIGNARPIVEYEQALAYALVGDMESALRLLDKADVGRHLDGAVARIEILSQLDRKADALKLFDELEGVEEEPKLRKLKAEIEAGRKPAFDVISAPSDGVALVFLTFAGALADGEDTDPLALIHARLAAYLSPQNSDARLMSAQLLQSYGQFDLAEKEYAALNAAGEVRPAAELARIDALVRADRMDDAIAAAVALTDAQPDLASGWVALGDLYRRSEKFAPAVKAYDRAITLLKDAPPAALWLPYYARGISLERMGRFDQAVPDFEQALKLSPDQPAVLNYLGYSYVDQNRNLDAALAMIKKAVALRPDDGAILDSLGWAYFRLGRYDEAVLPMEKAVAILPSDSLLNDHLGDVYWAAGRPREAEFQWRRALHLKPATPEAAARIEAKIERGLDAVLAEEKANGGKLATPAAVQTPDQTAQEAKPGDTPAPANGG